MKKPHITADSKIFSHLFHEGEFRVPWHQRRYDWKKTHVEELLNDIREAIRENSKCYFLGSVILVKKKNFWEINDGQQRMVTFSLICARLCRLFAEQGKSAQEFQALRILFDRDSTDIATLSDSGTYKPRLITQKDNQAKYNLMIRNKDIGANGKLTIAWNEIDRFFSDMDSNSDESKRFFDFLINKVEVACLYIPDDIDPNAVFETINCRGKPLEGFDLIKNYFYSFFNTKEEARRNTIHEDIEEVRTLIKDDTKTSEYARCFFQCKYGFLAKDNFYRSVRREIQRAGKSKKMTDYIFGLVKDFASKSHIELFRIMKNPSIGDQDSFISKFLIDSSQSRAKRTLAIFLKELQPYKVVQPIVFALLSHYIKQTDNKERKEIAKHIHGELKIFTSYMMRSVFAVPKFEPSHFEKKFSNLAQKIMSAQTLGDISVAEYIKEWDKNDDIMNDKKFISDISSIEIKSTSKVKRFLLSLNSYIQTDNDVISDNHCSVEHILPQSPIHLSGWKDFDEEKHKNYVNRLGNLTLLGKNDRKSDNDVNQNFPKKKEIYTRSAVKLTKEIMEEYESWSPDEIEKRQKELATLATKVWSSYQ